MVTSRVRKMVRLWLIFCLQIEVWKHGEVEVKKQCLRMDEKHGQVEVKTSGQIEVQKHGHIQAQKPGQNQVQKYGHVKAYQ